MATVVERTKQIGGAIPLRLMGRAKRRPADTHPSQAESPSRRMPRPAVITIVLVLGTGLLLPMFVLNSLGSAPTAFFSQWDHFSESLVLAKIESTTPKAAHPVAQEPGLPNADQVGLLIAAPNPIGVYDTFGGLKSGEKPTSTNYSEYLTQLGLQGFAFNAVYHTVCSSVTCLETVSGAMTAATLIGFAMLLCLIAPRSFSIVFLASAVASPWIIASARNLYWVPWTWFLPAIAAVCFTVATTRRNRVISGAALFMLFSLKFGMGFEFLTSVSLFAAGVPLLAHVFNRRHGRRLRSAIADASIIFAISLAAFGFILFMTCLVGGDGNLAAGLNIVYQHAIVRTYGGSSTDPVTALSLSISPLIVVAIYVFSWNTNVLSFGWGAPFQIAFGPHSMFPLIAFSILIVLARWLGRDAKWRRDLTVLLVGLAPPLSWIVLAKAHAFVHTPMDFVLWYLLCVSSLLWIAGAWLYEKLPQFIGRIAFGISQSSRDVRDRHVDPGSDMALRWSRSSPVD